MLTLELSVVAYGPEQIGQVVEMLMAPVGWLRYTVSWQLPDGGDARIPAELRRDDVTVHITPTRGVSLNRNNALDHAAADVVLPTDCDVRYDMEALARLRELFEASPDLDFLLFRHRCGDNKPYPEKEMAVFRKPAPGLNVCVYETALRRTAIERTGLRFDPRFGPNSTRFPAGEDDVFYLTMLRKGLRGRYVPLTVSSQNGMTTGFRQIDDPMVARTSGVVIGMLFPWTAFLRVPLKAVRMRRAGQYPFFAALRELGRGALQSYFLSRPWR